MRGPPWACGLGWKCCELGAAAELPLMAFLGFSAISIDLLPVGLWSDAAAGMESTPCLASAR